MPRRAAVVLAGILLAGCCRPCRPCAPCPAAPSAPWTGAPPEVGLLPLEQPEPGRWIPAAPAKPEKPTAEDRLAEVARAPDPVPALLALAKASPETVRDAPEEAWAPLLSARVRLVDLRDVARDGGDAPARALDLGADGSSDEGPVDPRVERIAEVVREALGADAWDPAHALLATRPWGLVVVQSPERWTDVEKALDRVAVTGGPSARVAALLADDGDALAAAVGLDGGGWVPEHVGRQPWVQDTPTTLTDPRSWVHARLDDAVWARAERVTRLPVLRVPLSGGRRVAAGRTSRVAYVQDFDLEVPPGNVALPVVGTLVAGTTLRGWREGDRWRVDLVRTEVVQPIPTFETTLASSMQPVTIELPEMRLARLGADLAGPPGAAAFVRGEGARIACLFRLEAHEDGGPPRPAWRWWVPREKRATVGPRREHGWPLALRIERPDRSREQGGTLVDTPTLLLTEGEEGVVTLQSEEAYVAGVELARSGSPRYADPVVGRLVTGLVVRAKVGPQPDGSSVVEGRIRFEDCDRPLRTLTTMAPGAPVAIQLPRTWRTDLPFRERLRPGESVEFPAHVRTAGGLAPVRVRLTLGEPVRLFTPWGRPKR